MIQCRGIGNQAGWKRKRKMKTVGLIGFGSMGGALVTSWLAAKALVPEQVMIATRTPAKAGALKAAYPALRVLADNTAVARESDVLILGVKTGDVKDLLTALQGHWREKTHLVTMSAGPLLQHLEGVFSGAITKTIPTLLAEVGRGVTLVHHNAKVNAADKQWLENVFRSSGQVREVPEEDFGVGADLTSCAPAFLASLLHEYVAAALAHSRFTAEEARGMVLETVLGTALLLQKREEDFQGLMTRVATPGGISEEGIKILKSEMPAVFSRLFQATLDKHQTVKAKVSAQFEGR
jgi:pyrroline-5-carboxylate reductase